MYRTLRSGFSREHCSLVQGIVRWETRQGEGERRDSGGAIGGLWGVTTSHEVSCKLHCLKNLNLMAYEACLSSGSEYF
ncbi:hypothetical protein J6590_004514 [Homalodisca vitripennis]|nr:hypothetical protein J6590_004514 [Homalodisca vitripennis]